MNNILVFLEQAKVSYKQQMVDIELEHRFPSCSSTKLYSLL